MCAHKQVDPSKCPCWLQNAAQLQIVLLATNAVCIFLLMNHQMDLASWTRGSRLRRLTLRPLLSLPLRILATEPLRSHLVSITFSRLGTLRGWVACWGTLVVEISSIEIAVVDPALLFDCVEVECLRGGREYAVSQSYGPSDLSFSTQRPPLTLPE